MYRLAIFDLDGTLLNSIGDLMSACNVALAHFNYPLHEEKDYKQFVGNGIYKLVERALPIEDRGEECVKEVKAVFDAYYKEHSLDQTRPYEGIIELLTALKAEGIPCCVLTNKAQAYAKELVKHFFGDLVQEVIGQREGIPTKPNPIGVIQLLESYKVEPSECIYVGDSNVDIKTAENAGVDAIGVLWGFRDEKELKEAGATYLAKDTHMLKTQILGEYK